MQKVDHVIKNELQKIQVRCQKEYQILSKNYVFRDNLQLSWVSFYFHTLLVLCWST